LADLIFLYFASTLTDHDPQPKTVWHEIAMNHWIIMVAAVCNALLIAVAARLIYKYLRGRALQTEELRDQKNRLERKVEERTRELVELSTHLQGVAEREKASLARELHDELGGLLVGARMDISWAEQHLAANEIDMKHRLNRVQQNLSAGIDLKRRIIEELRPTLLDNVGFIAALRWQFKETCARANLNCTKVHLGYRHRAVSHRARSFREHHQTFRRKVSGHRPRYRRRQRRVSHHRRW
jgi:signal transduction histidine kinase